MNAIGHVAGIILAGGRSRRMGVDKATLDWQGRPLLRHVVDVLAASVSPLAVAVGPSQVIPGLPGCVFISRDEVSFQGPLVAFQHALALIPRDVPVFLIGCDYPCVRSDVVNSLHRRLGEYDAVVPRVVGQAHPLLAVYRADIREAVSGVLEHKHRSMHALLDALSVSWVEDAEWAAIDTDGTMLLNVNTAEDYARALRSGGSGHATRDPAAP